MANVLIVLDGDYQFSGTGPRTGFTYTTLVGTLIDAGHQVTKAHRQRDASASEGREGFVFGTNLREFDMIWLIGWDGRNSTDFTDPGEMGIADSEVAAIARYMEDGGGIFATGDHDSIGSVMCGRIPRVRAMRSWYGEGDNQSPMPAGFPPNYPTIAADRADTTQRNPAGNYSLPGDPFVWFENQSDSVPQPIMPTTSPAHPILRRGERIVTVFPDHMHEGKTHGEVAGYAYDLTEFRRPATGERPMPSVIATGQTVPYASRSVGSPTSFGPASTVRPMNVLSVYDGRTAGVGRIVTGATFHHYVDINLIGDETVTTPEQLARTGPDAAGGHGFAHPGAEEIFADFKAVFVNITNWTARPPRIIRLILERSTFSQNEAMGTPDFDGAILVTVDGLKPSQFPNGGITPSLSIEDLQNRAPRITPARAMGLEILPLAVTSDDPTMPDRLQRFTFTYRVRFTGDGAFRFPEVRDDIRIDATLAADGVAAPLTDTAWIQLVRSANPFMLDLANGNTTPWLSSDVRVFRIIAGGDDVLGERLVVDAGRDEALAFLRRFVGMMTPDKFERLPLGATGSELSAFSTPTNSPKKVYNFAVARVRQGRTGAPASGVRVFFRVFPSPTTAALTYRSVAGVPIDGYRKTAGPGPIALPGLDIARNEWLSFPFFAATRAASPEMQTDPDNVKDVAPGRVEFFGALLDNNLADPYLPLSPTGDEAVPLRSLMMGEHQCLVAQIEFPDTPIPDRATPFTSDKLAQRNIVVSAVANPGLDASRMALHTFEIEATPHPISDALPPDELLLDWRSEPPDRTQVRIFIPNWNAEEVVALADRFYARHEIRVIEPHMIALPGGGVRYVPIPPSNQRQTGVIIADLPLGIVRGQHFDLAVRQVTNRSRQGDVPQPKARNISKEDAAKLIQSLQGQPTRRRGQTFTAAPPPRGVYDLGNNQVLITDLKLLDASGDHAVIVEHPDPALVEAARRESGRWRETIGAFQLAIPVSVKEDMLAHHLRLLSVLRWRAEWLRPNSRWHASFIRYVELIAEKVRALGGDPFAFPATPDGAILLPDRDGDQDAGDVGAGGELADKFFEPGADDWLGNTSGLDAPDKTKAGIWSGKVSGLLFDHFGDFEGFTLESYGGSHLRFFSREDAIRDLAEEAWRERYVVSVLTVSAQSRQVRRLLIRGYER